MKIQSQDENHAENQSKSTAGYRGEESYYSEEKCLKLRVKLSRRKNQEKKKSILGYIPEEKPAG